MPLAGEIITAGRIPGERIATTIATLDSAAIGDTETVVDTVIAPVVIGRIYRVRWITQLHSTVADDVSRTAIREDTAAGAILQLRRVHHPTSSTTQGFGGSLEAEYTADVTEDHTFVGSLRRLSGTGDIVAEGAAITPRYLYVDYIRG